MSTEIPKTPGVVTLRHVVMSVLNLMEDYTMRHFYRLMQIAIEGFSYLNLWHLDNIEVVYLTINSNKVAALPADFVDWLKIGIAINGRLRVITRHDNILLPRLADDGVTTVGNMDAGESQDATSLIYFSGHFSNNQYVGGLFGLAGGFDDAYYRVDRERRTITIIGTVTDNRLVLEYISSGVRLDGSTAIPREAIPALRSYILWQAIENDPRVAYNEKERRKRNHEEEVEALRSFQSTFTADEYRRMLWSTYRQTPKR